MLNDGFFTDIKKATLVVVPNLPPLVQGYLNYCFQDQVPEEVHLVHLTQTGYFRLKPNPDSTRGWLPLTAEQHIKTLEPTFIWFAKIRMNKLLWVDGWDYIINNQSNMHWNLNSLFNIVDEKGKHLDQGALMRYLAEVPWFPWALLYNRQITWEELDNQSAEATLTSNDLRVSAIFHFNSVGQIIRVSADRYRSINKNFELTPWTGYFRKYQKINGINLPTEGEVIWHLREGDYSYAKLKIKSVELDRSGQSYKIN